MARVDRIAAALFAERRKAYEKLKADLKLSEPKHAYEYLLHQEECIKELKEELEKYYAFFSTLRGLIPKQRSIHDRIG